MLRPNGRIVAGLALRSTGGIESALRSSFTKNGQIASMFNGSPASIPVGRRETAFALARFDGGMSVRIDAFSSLTSDVVGTGSVSITINGVSSINNAAMTGFRYGEATITGTGSVTNAPLSGSAVINANIRIGFNPSSDDITNNLLDAQIVENGLTVRNALRLITSILAGKVSGAEGSTVTFRNVSDTKNRIVANVDSNGNRTTITYDLTP